MPNTRSAEFRSAVEMVRTMLRHVLGGQMTPAEMAAWLRRAMTNDQHPMSDNEKSAIACALVLMLLGEDIEVDWQAIEDAVDRSPEAEAIARLI